MLNITIRDPFLYRQVRGWLELDGLSGANCTVTDEENLSSAAVPYVLLTSRTVDQSFVNGCEALSVPFLLSDLSAAVRRVCDNAKSGNGGIVLSEPERSILVNERKVTLSAREYALFAYLYANRGKTVSREELHKAVWNGQEAVRTNVVDVYISYLRRKMEPLFGKGVIVSIRNEGYSLIL